MLTGLVIKMLGIPLLYLWLEDQSVGLEKASNCVALFTHEEEYAALSAAIFKRQYIPGSTLLSNREVDC